MSTKSTRWTPCPRRSPNCRPKSPNSSGILTIPISTGRIARNSTKPLMHLRKRKRICRRPKTNGWSLKCYVKRSNKLEPWDTFWRHCEERSDEAIHSAPRKGGLLRFARNDEDAEIGVDLMTTPLAAKIAREYGTPAAVIDMDRVERNIARIQAALRRRRMRHRPKARRSRDSSGSHRARARDRRLEGTDFCRFHAVSDRDRLGRGATFLRRGAGRHSRTRT